MNTVKRLLSLVALSVGMLGAASADAEQRRGKVEYYPNPQPGIPWHTDQTIATYPLTDAETQSLGFPAGVTCSVTVETGRNDVIDRPYSYQSSSLVCTDAQGNRATFTTSISISTSGITTSASSEAWRDGSILHVEERIAKELVKRALKIVSAN